VHQGAVQVDVTDLQATQLTAADTGNHYEPHVQDPGQRCARGPRLSPWPHLAASSQDDLTAGVGGLADPAGYRWGGWGSNPRPANYEKPSRALRVRYLHGYHGVVPPMALIAPFARVARSTNRYTPYHGDHRLLATERYRRPRLPILYGAHFASRQGDAFPMLQTVSARRFAGRRMANRDH
jgi:hypothetical protein